MARILVMLPNNHGDVLMVTSALRRLKKDGHTVHFLVDADSSELVSNNPNIDKLHILPRRAVKKNLNSSIWKIGLKELENFVSELKSFSFDRIVNCFQGDTTAIIAGMLDASEIIGQKIERNGSMQIGDNLTQLLYAIPYARKYAPAHASDFYSYMCGAKSDNEGTELFLSEEVKSTANIIFSESGLIPDKTIVLHHGSAHKKKEWPAKNFSELIKLLDAAGYYSILTGTSIEREQADSIIELSKSKNVLNLCGKTSMLETAAVISKSALLVSGDTFAMHLATSLRTPVVAIFAPTSPIETGPFTEGATVISANCRCFGNYEGSCAIGRSCMAEISSSEVMNLIVGKKCNFPDGCTVWRSQFDKESGLIDYVSLNDGKSGYSEAARSVFHYFNNTNSTSSRKIAEHEFSLLIKFKNTLHSNIDLLSRLRTLKDSEQVRACVTANASIERELNLYDHFPALLATWLRLRNNSIQSNDLQSLIGGFLNNARELSLFLESVTSNILTDKREWPKVRTETDLSQIDYPNLVISTISSDEDFLFIANNKLIPSAGILYTMVGLLQREKDVAGCCAKILNNDDSIKHAGYVISGDASLSPLFATLPRFDRSAVQIATIDSAEPMAVLIKKEYFHLFDKNQTIFREALLAFRQNSLKLLYCPDAEAYLAD